MNPMDAKSLLDAIWTRVSTRTFEPGRTGPGGAEALERLLEAQSSLPGPFGSRIKLGLALGDGEAKPAKMGTYGLISGAYAYAAAAAAPVPGAFEDLGWVLEGFVLEAAALGWDSCWIGGLFDRGAAAVAAGAGPGQMVPAVIALGKAAARPSLAERLVRGAAKARTRKPLDEIGSLRRGDSLEALSEAWRTVLEAVRAAPSASNKQPWRLVSAGPAAGGEVKNLAWDLYMAEDYAYNHALGAVRIQNIDMGIAMRHFSEAAAALGLPGAWSAGSGSVEDKAHVGQGWKLIASWR